MRYYLAIDIGASSGRHIVGWQEDGRLQTKEVYRFPNGVEEADGHLTWDIEALVREVKEGIQVAKTQFPKIESLSIDTWGVDYVLLKGNEEVLPAYAYRDSRTEMVIPQVHEKVPFAELYRRTGCQFQPFNTVYQLYDEKVRGRLEGVTDMLMMPEYLLWKLCGVKAREYTNATTMGMVNAQTGQFDLDIVDALGYPRQLFPKLCRPGTVLGEYEGIRCVLCATHDTGSAFLAIPAVDENAVYISSGTWSLLGVENDNPITTPESHKHNFTNEGGAWSRYRYLKNIMGLWMIQSVRRELNGVNYVQGKHARTESAKQWGFPDLIEAAKDAEGFSATVDVNRDCFLSPDSMIEAIREECRRTKQIVPETVGQIMQCIYQSLALCYRDAIRGLEQLTGKRLTSINIVGGGCQDGYLNGLTAKVTGLPVYAGPVEGTAIGNLIVQMVTAGEIKDLQSARDTIRASFGISKIQL